MKHGSFNPVVMDQRQLKIEFEKEQERKQNKRAPPDIVYLHTEKVRRGESYIIRFKPDITDTEQQVINDRFKLIFRQNLDSLELRIQRQVYNYLYNGDEFPEASIPYFFCYWRMKYDIQSSLMIKLDHSVVWGIVAYNLGSLIIPHQEGQLWQFSIIKKAKEKHYLVGPPSIRNINEEVKTFCAVLDLPSQDIRKMNYPKLNHSHESAIHMLICMHEILKHLKFYVNWGLNYQDLPAMRKFLMDQLVLACNENYQ